MSNLLGSLYVELKANTAAFVEGMSSASYAAKQAGRDIESSFSKLGQIASTALMPFGTIGAEIGQSLSNIGLFANAAGKEMSGLGGRMSLVGISAGVAAGAVTALAAATAGSAIRTAEMMAKMYQAAQAAGVSVSALSALAFAAKQAGVDQATLVTGLERMSKSSLAAAEAPKGASNAYTQLGISVKNVDGTMRSTTEIFGAIADRFAKMTDGAVKTADAIAIFGRGGAALIPMLNQGSDEIEHWIDIATRMGVVLSDQDAGAAHEFEQSLNVLGLASEGLQTKLAVGLLPTLQALASYLERALPDPSSAVNRWIGVLDGLTNAFLKTMAVAVQLKSTTSALFDLSMGQFLKDVKAANAEYNSMAASINQIGKPMYGPPRPAAGGGADGDPLAPGKDEAQKKLATAIENVTKKLKEEYDTIGLTATQIADYTLKQEGASAAEIKAIDLLRQKVYLQQQQSKETNASTIGIARMRGESAGTTAFDLGQSLNGIMAAGDQLSKLGPIFDGLGTSLDQNVGKAVKNVTADLQEQISTYGKSAEQLEYYRLQQEGATAEQLAGVKQLQDQLKKLQDSTEPLSRSLRTLGESFTRSMADAIVKGKGFKTVLDDVLKSLTELLLKQALFGTAKSGGAGNGLVGLLGGIFSSVTGGGGGGSSSSAGISGLLGGLLKGIIPGLAVGGYVSASSAYVVGENGPEMFVPHSAGTVVPRGGMGGTTIYNFDNRGADAGSERRMRQALADHENRAVRRALATTRELQLRGATT